MLDPRDVQPWIPQGFADWVYEWTTGVFPRASENGASDFVRELNRLAERIEGIAGGNFHGAVKVNASMVSMSQEQFNAFIAPFFSGRDPVYQALWQQVMGLAYASQSFSRDTLYAKLQVNIQTVSLVLEALIALALFYFTNGVSLGWFLVRGLARRVFLIRLIEALAAEIAEEAFMNLATEGAIQSAMVANGYNLDSGALGLAAFSGGLGGLVGHGLGEFISKGLGRAARGTWQHNIADAFSTLPGEIGRQALVNMTAGAGTWVVQPFFGQERGDFWETVASGMRGSLLSGAAFYVPGHLQRHRPIIVLPTAAGSFTAVPVRHRDGSTTLRLFNEEGLPVGRATFQSDGQLRIQYNALTQILTNQPGQQTVAVTGIDATTAMPLSGVDSATPPLVGQLHGLRGENVLTWDVHTDGSVRLREELQEFDGRTRVLTEQGWWTPPAGTHVAFDADHQVIYSVQAVTDGMSEGAQTLHNRQAWHLRDAGGRLVAVLQPATSGYAVQPGPATTVVARSDHVVVLEPSGPVNGETQQFAVLPDGRVLHERVPAGAVRAGTRAAPALGVAPSAAGLSVGEPQATVAPPSTSSAQPTAIAPGPTALPTTSTAVRSVGHSQSASPAPTPMPAVPSGQMVSAVDSAGRIVDGLSSAREALDACRQRWVECGRPDGDWAAALDQAYELLHAAHEAIQNDLPPGELEHALTRLRFAVLAVANQQSHPEQAQALDPAPISVVNGLAATVTAWRKELADRLAVLSTQGGTDELQAIVHFGPGRGTYDIPVRLSADGTAVVIDITGLQARTPPHVPSGQSLTPERLAHTQVTEQLVQLARTAGFQTVTMRPTVTGDAVAGRPGTLPFTPGAQSEYIYTRDGNALLRYDRDGGEVRVFLVDPDWFTRDEHDINVELRVPYPDRPVNGGVLLLVFTLADDKPTVLAPVASTLGPPGGEAPDASAQLVATRTRALAEEARHAADRARNRALAYGEARSDLYGAQDEVLQAASAVEGGAAALERALQRGEPVGPLQSTLEQDLLPVLDRALEDLVAAANPPVDQVSVPSESAPAESPPGVAPVESATPSAEPVVTAIDAPAQPSPPVTYRPVSYIGGGGEPLRIMPSDPSLRGKRIPFDQLPLYEQYRRLGSATWQEGERFVRKLFNALPKVDVATSPDIHRKPSIIGMSEKEARQAHEVDAASFEVVLDPGQWGFTSWRDRIFDGLLWEAVEVPDDNVCWIRQRGSLEVKHYLRFRHGHSGPGRVPLRPEIQKELVDDYFYKEAGLEPLWVFTMAPPSDQLAQALRDLGIPFTVLAPARRTKADGGPTADAADFMKWVNRELRRHSAESASTPQPGDGVAAASEVGPPERPADSGQADLNEGLPALRETAGPERDTAAPAQVSLPAFAASSAAATQELIDRARTAAGTAKDQIWHYFYAFGYTAGYDHSRTEDVLAAANAVDRGANALAQALQRGEPVDQLQSTLEQDLLPTLDRVVNDLAAAAGPLVKQEPTSVEAALSATPRAFAEQVDGEGSASVSPADDGSAPGPARSASAEAIDDVLSRAAAFIAGASPASASPTTRRFLGQLIDGEADAHRLLAEAVAALAADIGADKPPVDRVPARVAGAVQAMAALHQHPDSSSQVREAVEDIVRDLLAVRPDLRAVLARLEDPAGPLVLRVVQNRTNSMRVVDPAPDLRPAMYEEWFLVLHNSLAVLEVAEATEKSVVVDVPYVAWAARVLAARLAGAVEALTARAEEKQLASATAKAKLSADSSAETPERQLAERADRQHEAYQRAAVAAREAEQAYVTLTAALRAVADRQVGMAEVVAADRAAREKYDMYLQRLLAAGPALPALHNAVPAGNLPFVQQMADHLAQLPELAGNRLTVPYVLEEVLRAEFRQASSPDGVVLRSGGVEVRVRLRLTDAVEVINPTLTSDQMILGQFPQQGRPTTAVVNQSVGGSVRVPVSKAVAGVVKLFIPELASTVEAVPEVVSANVTGDASRAYSYSASFADYNQTGSVVDNRGPSSLYVVSVEASVAVRRAGYDADSQWQREVAAGRAGESAWEHRASFGGTGSRDGLMEIWLQHAYTEPTLPATVTRDAVRYGDSRLDFPRHVVTGMTGLDHLGDLVLNQVPQLYWDALTVEQIRTGLNAVAARLDVAVNEDSAPGADNDGYWFPVMHKGAPVGIVRVRGHLLEGDTGQILATPIGSASNEMHQERLEITFSPMTGAATASTAWQIGGDGGVSLAAPGPDRAKATVGASGSLRRSASHSIGVGGTPIYVKVQRYAGRTQAYQMTFVLEAAFESFQPGARPPKPVAVESQALIRMPEPDAFLFGLPVDARAYTDGKLRGLGYRMPTEGYDTTWPSWLGTSGAGNSTIRDVRGLDAIYGELEGHLIAEGLLPERDENRAPIWSPDPGIREAQLHNLREVSEQFNPHSLAGRFDVAAQSGVLLELIKPWPSVGSTLLSVPQRVTYRVRIQMNPDAALFKGLTDDEKIVTLPIASESFSRTRSVSRAHTVIKPALQLSSEPGVGIEPTELGLSFNVTDSRSGSSIDGSTVNDVWLTEATGPAAVFDMPFTIVVTNLTSEQSWTGPGSAEILIPADHLDISRRAKRETKSHTPASKTIMRRAKVIHIDASDLVAAANTVLNGLAGPGSAVGGQIASLTNARTLATHLKEMLDGDFRTDLLVNSRGLRPRRTWLAIAAETAGVVEHLGSVGMVTGDFNFTLQSFGVTRGDSRTVAIDGSLSVTYGDYDPSWEAGGRGGATWSETQSRSHTDQDISGLEQLAIGLGDAYVFKTTLRYTVTGGTTEQSANVSGTVVFVLSEHEALRHYANGDLPVGIETITNVLERWREDQLEIDRNVLVKTIDRYVREPGDDRQEREGRATELYPKVAALFPDVGTDNRRNPVEAIHQLAIGGHLPKPAHQARTLPDYLVEAIGNTPIETAELLDDEGRPISLLNAVLNAVNEVAPGAVDRLPGLREGLRSQLGGTRWFGSGHAHTMVQPHGLVFRVRVPVGVLFAEDLVIRLTMRRGKAEHQERLPNLGFESQRYRYHEVTDVLALDHSIGGNLSGNSEVVPAGDAEHSLHPGASTSRTRRSDATVGVQTTTLQHWGNFTSGADRFAEPIEVTITVQRMLFSRLSENPVLRCLVNLRPREVERVLPGQWFRLVPNDVVGEGPRLQPPHDAGFATRAPWPDVRVVERLPTGAFVVSSGGSRNLLGPLKEGLERRSMLGAHGLDQRNLNKLENALSASNWGALLPVMARPEGHELLRLADPRDPGREVVVHVKARLYDLRVTHGVIPKNRIGTVNRYQQLIKHGTSEGRLLPVTFDVGGDASLSLGGVDILPPIEGTVGAQAADSFGTTAGQRNETTVKESSESTNVTFRVTYDVVLLQRKHDHDGRVTNGPMLMLPGVGTGTATLRLSTNRIKELYRQLEAHTGPRYDRIWQMLDQRDASAPTVDLDDLIKRAKLHPNYDPRRPVLTVAAHLQDSLRGFAQRPYPVIRATARVSAADEAEPEVVSYARMVAVDIGAELVLDLNTPAGPTHLRVMPDGSVHSVDPDQGFAAALATLPPEVLAKAHESKLDLRTLYLSRTNQHRSFADAVRVHLNIPFSVPGLNASPGARDTGPIGAGTGTWPAPEVGVDAGTRHAGSRPLPSPQPVPGPLGDALFLARGLLDDGLTDAALLPAQIVELHGLLDQARSAPVAEDPVFVDVVTELEALRQIIDMLPETTARAILRRALIRLLDHDFDVSAGEPS